MHLNHKSLLLIAAILVAHGGAFAQDRPATWAPRTGDAWIDQALADVNRYGERYRDAFVDEMVRYYGAPRDYVDELMGKQQWKPGDVYYACAIAQIVGRSCRYVVEEWQRDHEQGWGGLAQRMGIQPGSAQFQQLKSGFALSYKRWSRPLPG
ncbi:MAG: hypothetical protein ABIR05_02405 [Luteimonas sp.]